MSSARGSTFSLIIILHFGNFLLFLKVFVLKKIHVPILIFAAGSGIARIMKIVEIIEKLINLLKKHTLNRVNSSSRSISLVRLG